MRIAIAQINPIVADINGNYEKILSCINKARGIGADLVVFPEMATIGYPPMDLLQNTKLVDDNLVIVERIAANCSDIAVICGYVDYDQLHKPMLFNAAAFILNGTVQSRHYKTLLPMYDVFDELRYFNPGHEQLHIEYLGNKIGITICEDIWNDLSYNDIYIENRSYPVDPVKNLVRQGIDLLVNISASPYVMGKNTEKWKMLATIARKNSVPVLYINQVGGNDSLLFDGNSVYFDRNGICRVRAKDFTEDLVVFDDTALKEAVTLEESELEDIRRALVMGLRDYARKCGFTKAVLGLSGGIDSALTAALAVQALGPDNVLGITMPSMYSSKGSVEDSRKLAVNLGIRIEEINIIEIFENYKKHLSSIFSDTPEDVTEENIQARIRGNLLMAVSNKFNSLLLATGNKSELAMGYCTLYGDMSGGLAVISDLPKTLVFRLSRHINRQGEIIPREIIEKPPSAELRENQRDEDSLPPYELLDGILELYIEQRMSVDEIVQQGFPKDIVLEVLKTVDRNEFKRRQASPGLKVTTKAFGIGRRIPMAQKLQP